MSDLLEADDSEKALADAIRSESEAPPQPEPAPAPEPEPAPPPAETVASDPVTPPVPAPAPTPPEQKVNLGALREERERRRQLERELEALRNPPKPEPDETTDPIGTITSLKQQLAQIRQQQAQAAEAQALAQKARASGQERFNAHPEYADQEKFVGDMRRRQLAVVGTRPEMIEAIIQNEALSLVRQAEASDTTYADIVANLAVAMGWQAKAAPPALAVPAPATPTPPPANPEAEAALDRLERGQKIATSPSKSGGGAPNPVSNTDDIEAHINLQGAAWDSWVEKWRAGNTRKFSRF